MRKSGLERRHEVPLPIMSLRLPRIVRGLAGVPLVWWEGMCIPQQTGKKLDRIHPSISCGVTRLRPPLIAPKNMVRWLVCMGPLCRASWAHTPRPYLNPALVSTIIGDSLLQEILWCSYNDLSDFHSTCFTILPSYHQRTNEWQHYTYFPWRIQEFGGMGGSGLLNGTLYVTKKSQKKKKKMNSRHSYVTKVFLPCLVHHLDGNARPARVYDDHLCPLNPPLSTARYYHRSSIVTAVLMQV